MTTQLYVGNMNYKIEEVDLGELFEQYGVVNHVRIISNQKTSHFGFVEMEDNDDAEQAILALNKALWKDRKIVVNIARKRIDRMNFRY